MSRRSLGASRGSQDNCGHLSRARDNPSRPGKAPALVRELLVPVRELLVLVRELLVLVRELFRELLVLVCELRALVREISVDIREAISH